MKTIIITGASSGVGKQLAKTFKNEKLILLSRNEAKLVAFAKTLKNAEAYICDISDIHQVKTTFDKITKKYNKIDVLINCAGVWTKGELSQQGNGHIAEINSLERIKQVIDTNTYGTIAMIKSIVPIMQKQGYGQIININSQSGVIVEEFCPVYNASKQGSRAFSKAIQSDLAKQNIRLTDICPGLIKTDFYNNANDPLPESVMETGLDASDVANLVKYVVELPSNITLPSIEIKDMKNF